MAGTKLVLVVDDDASVRTSLARLLGGYGFLVRTFESARGLLDSDAVEASCIVVDVHLGGMSGFELDDELRVRGLSCPLIFISAQDDDATRARAARAGAYLRKPFEAAELLRAVTDAIEQSRPRRSGG